ncbi:hypothetical protein [Cystobacter ferrugineus]|uniref:Prevent-host-death protein n=1 Tax=Cystobacter ferrugineus TaxID=83449 RepID=A0A1L9AYT1_9BACT|nr:hypothetical protein [Cystobacter ferrugineus]OJH35169.1 hypothetical protein BON30_39600 [Cystobacter ferrugineus]
MATHELTWSAFLREPTSVEPMLEKGDVLLKRRDGEALRLSRESRGANTRQAIIDAVRLLRADPSADPIRGSDRGVTNRLPWTRFLPEEDRLTFVTEFIDHLEACADLGDFTALGRLLEEWKNTAAAYADGVAPALKRPVKAVGGRVPRPGR